MAEPCRSILGAHGPPVPPGHLAELVPPLLPGHGGFRIPKMSWADLCYGTATNPRYGLEPLTAIRELGCRYPIISYFLLRGGEEGPLQESGIQT
jgi:hypothetical protein